MVNLQACWPVPLLWDRWISFISKEAGGSRAEDSYNGIEKKNSLKSPCLLVVVCDPMPIDESVIEWVVSVMSGQDYSSEKMGAHHGEGVPT